MKKYLLLLSVFALALTATAASKREQNQARLRYAEREQVRPSVKATRRSAGNIEGGRVVGYFTNEMYTDRAFMNEGEWGAAIYLSPEMLKKYVGCQLTAVKFCVTDINYLKDVRVFASTDLSKPDVATGTVKKLDNNWNTQKFDQPYTIREGEGIYVGYKLTQTVAMYGCASIVFNSISESNGSFLTWEDGEWNNFYGSGFGCVCVQGIVEGDLPAEDIVLGDFSINNRYYKNQNDTLDFYLFANSMGTEDIEGFTLGVYFDEVKAYEMVYDATVNLDGVELMERLPLRTMDVGNHKVSFRIEGIGSDMHQPSAGTADDDQVTENFAVYSNSLTRQKLLTEYFTHQHSADSMSTVALNKAISSRNDVAAVFIHGDYYGSDTYTDAFAVPEALELAKIVNNRPPTMAVNRFMLPGANFTDQSLSWVSSESMSPYISQVMFDGINSLQPAFATVNITGKVDRQNRVAEVTITGLRSADFKKLFGNGWLTVMVTEDGLRGNQQGFDDIATDFEHNHVLRKVVTNVFGDEITWSGLRYSKTYTFKIDSNWNVDKLNVVAFIGHAVNEDAIDVTNANNLSFRDMEDATLQMATGISETEEATRRSDIYTLSGLRLDAPTRRGVYIQNGRKVFIK